MKKKKLLDFQVPETVCIEKLLFACNCEKALSHIKTIFLGLVKIRDSVHDKYRSPKRKEIKLLELDLVLSFLTDKMKMNVFLCFKAKRRAGKLPI